MLEKETEKTPAISVPKDALKHARYFTKQPYFTDTGFKNYFRNHFLFK